MLASNRAGVAINSTSIESFSIGHAKGDRFLSVSLKEIIFEHVMSLSSD